MKNNEVKSFVFQVAQETEKQAQWKAAEGSAEACGNRNWDGCGGCTLVDYGWGREPMTTPGIGGDGPVWC